MLRHHTTLLTFALSATLAAGCGETKTELPKGAGTKSTAEAKHEHKEGEAKHEHKEGAAEHEHGKGPHGGSMQDWGGDKFHLEFVVDDEKKQATVYLLTLEDAKVAKPLKAGMLTLSLTKPKKDIVLTAMPLEGETDGMSSKFVGTDDALGIEGDIVGNVSAEADGTPYEGEVKHSRDEHDLGKHEHGKDEKKK